MAAHHDSTLPDAEAACIAALALEPHLLAIGSIAKLLLHLGATPNVVEADETNFLSVALEQHLQALGEVYHGQLLTALTALARGRSDAPPVAAAAGGGEGKAA